MKVLFCLATILALSGPAMAEGKVTEFDLIRRAIDLERIPLFTISHTLIAIEVCRTREQALAERCTEDAIALGQLLNSAKAKVDEAGLLRQSKRSQALQEANDLLDRYRVGRDKWQETYLAEEVAHFRSMTEPVDPKVEQYPQRR